MAMEHEGVETIFRSTWEHKPGEPVTKQGSQRQPDLTLLPLIEVAQQP